MSKEGGPAFPVREGAAMRFSDERGMSLRDYFAAAAIQGMCVNGFIPDQARKDDVSKWDYAAAAYTLADAMLAEREKP